MSSRSKRKRDDVDTASVLVDGDVFTFTTWLRGARFCEVGGVAIGEFLECDRQPDKPFDKNALGLHRRNNAFDRVGYLSRDICSLLAPYLDRKCVTLYVHVIDIKRKSPSPMEIRIDVHGTIHEQFDADTRYEFEKALREALRPLNGLSSSRVLTQNAKMMLNDVMRDHSHLFGDEERQIYMEMLHLDVTATALLLRLYVRKGTWFRLDDPNHFDRKTFEASVDELIRLEFLQCSARAPHAERISIMSSTPTVIGIKKLLRCYRSQNAVCRIQGCKDTLMRELERLLHQVERFTP